MASRARPSIARSSRRRAGLHLPRPNHVETLGRELHSPSIESTPERIARRTRRHRWPDGVRASAMQRGDAARARQPRQQRRVVAVADEELRRARQRRPIEKRKDVNAAIASADRDQRDTDESFQCLMNDAARSAPIPRGMSTRSRNGVVVAGTNPRRVNSDTPRSNSSRANGLAGATIPIRSPGLSGRGLRMLIRAMPTMLNAQCSTPDVGHWTLKVR